MRLPIADDERAALQFEDLASALDAGLPLASLGGDVTAGERAVHTILRNRGVRLSASEDACFVASAKAGRIPAALRERAALRRDRAAFLRQIAGGLAYPLILLAVAIVVGILLAPLFGPGLPITIAGTLVALAALAWWVRRGLRGGEDRWLEVPVLGPIARGLGEQTYLETLQGAYAAGIPVLDAHALATTTVAVAAVRVRLRKAEQLVRNGSTLTEGLAATQAVHPETLQLLGTGEHAGHLEEAAGRALRRRRDVVGRAITRLAKGSAFAIYGAGMAICVYMILSFWLSYFARLRM